jgi:hypothetical protein
MQTWFSRTSSCQSLSARWCPRGCTERFSKRGPFANELFVADLGTTQSWGSNGSNGRIAIAILSTSITGSNCVGGVPRFFNAATGALINPGPAPNGIIGETFNVSSDCTGTGLFPIAIPFRERCKIQQFCEACACPIYLEAMHFWDLFGAA